MRLVFAAMGNGTEVEKWKGGNKNEEMKKKEEKKGIEDEEKTKKKERRKKRKVGKEGGKKCDMKMTRND